MWAEDFDAKAQKWAKDVEAVKTQPSYPHLTDEWEATNPSLWERVLEVAQGRLRSYTVGGRTINSPNNGAGYYPWPHPKGIAWAVKQYNGFGGKWKRQEEEAVEASVKTAETKLDDEVIPDPKPLGGFAFRNVRDLVKPEPEARPKEERIENITDNASPVTPAYKPKEADWDTLNFLRLGAVMATRPGDPEHQTLQGLQKLSYVHGQEHNGRTYWDITRRGSFVVLAGLKDELTKRMKPLMKGNLDANQLSQAAGAVAKWIDQNFRINTTKTPRGQRRLKDEAKRLWYVLDVTSQGGVVDPPGSAEMIGRLWANIKPDLDDLVRYFTTEGDRSQGKKETLLELKLAHATYYNRANLSDARFQKFAASVDQTLGSVRGWRAKALKGSLKVEFVGADLRVQGKYVRAKDTMLVRATPKVLKRGDNGYASFNYILIHELGHRYERYNSLPTDFDTHSWRTTRYSFNDGESFAELFALGHFKLTGSWDQKKIERFERVMSGGPEFVPAQPAD